METSVRTDLPRAMLRKVPEITIFFWIIKVLATTVGETGGDFLSETLHLGLTNTTYVMSALLAVALFVQFRARRYVAGIYWLAVVLISVVGTLFSDNLVDHFGVPLAVTTAIFGTALVITFAAWYASEKTLSIHTVTTTKREGFYWLAILFTFALGTAAGDWLAEGINVGYWRSALLFAAMIGVVAAVYYGRRLREVPAFWIAYILTRPLGASIGDFLSQSRRNGGLGFGTVGTSGLFVATIVCVVIYLTITRRDQAPVLDFEGATATA